MAGAAATLDLAHASADQLAQYARAEAAASTRAATAPIRAQEDVAAAQSAAHGKAIQGFATALATLLKGVGPQISDEYTHAANSDAAFAKGFSDHLQSQIGSSNDDTNAFLSKMGAPASALKATPNVGDVTYGLGGAIPATALSHAGAGFAAAADLLPGSIASRGLSDFTANEYAGETEQQKLEAQIAAIAAKSPAAAATFLDKLQSRQVQQQRLDLDQNKAAETSRKNQLTSLLSATGSATLDPKTGLITMNPAVRAQAAKLLGVPPSAITGLTQAQWVKLTQDQIANGFTQQRIDISSRNANTSAARLNFQTNPRFDASRSRALGYAADQYGNPIGKTVQLLPGFGYDKSGSIVKRSSTKTSKVHGLTTAQINKLKGEALGGAQVAANGAPATTKSDALPKITYNEGLLRGRQHGIPDWILIPALNKFYKPGGDYSPVAGPPAPGEG